MKKQTLDKRTYVLIGLAALVVLLLFSIIIYNVMKPKNNSVPPMPSTPDINLGTNDKPNETDDLLKVKIDLVEYEVFQYKEIDFQFVIAKFRIKDDQPIRITLDKFKTSEGIQLDNVDQYIQSLEKEGMYLGKKNVILELVSTEDSMIANLFIPITNKTSKSIQLITELENNKEFTFDLTKNKVTSKEELGYTLEDIITDGKTYQMTISSAYAITGEPLYKNDEAENYPSTAELYAFKIVINSLWGDVVKIEEAKYIVDGTEKEFSAFASSYTTEKRKNILGKEIKENDSGYLLFMTLNPDREPITYKGKVRIRLQGQTNWIEIKVNL